MSVVQPVSDSTPLWSDAVFASAIPSTRLLGVLPGEGIGTEVVSAALSVLDALDSVRPLGIRRVTGGPIGLAAEPIQGNLTPPTIDFCRSLFQSGGALLCGPGGGRFVYDLRQRFDLFSKIVPLKPSAILRPNLADVDILVVRDNAAGIYQGQGTTRTDASGHLVAEHTFAYSEPQVERLLRVAARLALQRRGHLHVVIKDAGVPTISNLWKSVTQVIAAQFNVKYSFLNADYAAYQLIQDPRELDVLVTPNMIGDILADLGAVLLGSRGLSFSGNFSPSGSAVYQTGHGSAYDVAGTDQGNPVAQILSLAMLLRQSFRLSEEADLIERAIDLVWQQGFRTEDLAFDGCQNVGTRQLAARIADTVADLARKNEP